MSSLLECQETHRNVMKRLEILRFHGDGRKTIGKYGIFVVSVVSVEITKRTHETRNKKGAPGVSGNFLSQSSLFFMHPKLAGQSLVLSIPMDVLMLIGGSERPIANVGL